MTVYKLGDQFGVHRDRISRILEAAGVDRRYHQTVDVDLNRAAKLEAEGLSLTRIAEQLGVGRTTLVAPLSHHEKAATAGGVNNSGRSRGTRSRLYRRSILSRLDNEGLVARITRTIRTSAESLSSWLCTLQPRRCQHRPCPG